MTSRPGTTRRRLPTSPFAVEEAAPAVEYDVDDRVTHDRFGMGRVQSTEFPTWVTARFSCGLVRVLNNSKLSKI
ncbi:hypothetical protein CLV92_11458 [Kineococcus xinjiangensis]|uniref:Uncharacterized protein n=1 Tax=Kineococcus xinjiangensis TaxID=512762 RepID=A0A2S6IE34_9ACTN|nr:hypothetical protein [Kineococcus xinjiangensis]PPK92457.1 hypothetical protein CLV92_11458 [Kineococcus xinjiangensis]